MTFKISVDGQPLDLGLDKLLQELKKKQVTEALNKVLEQVDSLRKVTTSGSLRRSIMGFDQLNRLSAGSGGSGTEESSLEKMVKFLTEPTGFQDTVNAVKEFSDTFRHELFNSSVVGEKFRSLLEQVHQGGSLVGRTLLSVGESAQLMAQSAGQTGDRVDWLISQLFATAEAADQTEKMVKGAWSGMSGWFSTTVHAPIKADIATLWDDMAPEARQSLQEVKALFSNAGGHFAESFKSAWISVEDVFSDGGSVFESLTDGVLTGFKSMVNRLIGGINQVVVEPFSGINDAFSKLKSFSFGGLTPFKNLNFSISMPKIPYLAQGAVLPANKPFMAVVGDQKHGTNVEAPLDVIRQAVAEVMEDSVAAQLAGHSATVEVLQQILEAVLGISLDEGTVTRAVERHQHRMAVMRGGF